MLSNAHRMPHPFVSRLKSDNYRLWNVGGAGGKAPVDRFGNPLNDWQNMTAARLAKEHKMSSPNWGMPMGHHPENGKYILALDFDVCGDKDKVTGLPQNQGAARRVHGKCADVGRSVFWWHSRQYERPH